MSDDGPEIVSYVPKPVHLSSADERDPNEYDLAFIERNFNTRVAQHAQRYVPYANLSNIYGPQANTYKLEVRQPYESMRAHTYMDLGTGIGLTVKACSEALRKDFQFFDMTLVDNADAMMAKAVDAVEHNGPSGHKLGGVGRLVRSYVNVFGDCADIRTKLFPKLKINGLSLITCQRVLLHLKKNRRARQLRRWAALLDVGGRLIVDVPDPLHST